MATSMASKSCYRNPWPSFKPLTLQTLLASLFYHGPSVSPDISLPVQVASNLAKPSQQHPRVIWLGHASVYLQLPCGDHSTLGILFDPIFSSRCSPIKWLGPKRRLPPPCAVADLPGVNVVVISHDHYDHLDQSTIHEIEVHHGAVRYLVPSGVGNWFRKLGILSERVIELGWWEEMTLDLSATASPTDSTGEVHHQLIPLDSERGHSSADLQSDTVSPGIKEIRIIKRGYLSVFLWRGYGVSIDLGWASVPSVPRD
ncbi:MAG: hypothetical protein TREMPRED_004955 [Tremellales sp. Tagirdzhanova-0007]|nr:MAG: hypothetical protein TREMPRED_004955 [Tremellales sp. Tagirdzhanova-0007]